jgi:hypothetical protein
MFKIALLSFSQSHSPPSHRLATSAPISLSLRTDSRQPTGALCGKQSISDDPFAQPGRTVGSAPPPQTRASVPKVSGQGQTLGGSSTGGGGGDARSAAAKAAEVGDTELDANINRLAPRFKRYPHPWAVMRIF